MLFLQVLFAILIIIVLIACLMWPIIIWLIGDAPFWDWSIRTKVLHTVGSVLLFAFILSLCIPLIGNDNSAHCGPGTRYISESHYNPATKTTITDWECVAN